MERIQTKGSYQRLPRDGMSVVLLANDTALTASVRQWLEDRNLRVIYAATIPCVSCDVGTVSDDRVL